MSEKIELNRKQLTLVLANLLTVKMIFAFPRYIFSTSGNAAWIQAIYMTLIAFALLEITLFLYRFTGNKNILQMAENIGGAPLKIIVSLITAVLLAANVGTEIRIFAESVKIILLPMTEIEYIMLLFAVTVAIGSYSGFRSVSTINAIFFPFCLFFLGFMSVVLVKNYNINNLFPIFGKGVEKIFINGLSDLSCFSDIIALNLLLPYCRDLDMVKKSGRSALAVSGAVITLLCLVYGAIYPYPYTSEFFLTTYQLSRMVRAGEYFQRFEALFEFVWAITQLLYSSMYICIICSVLGSAFKLKYKNDLIPCTITIITFLSYEPGSVAALLDSAERINGYLFPAAYILPISIPLLYIVLRRAKHEV